jgi:hypothetical protein
MPASPASQWNHDCPRPPNPSAAPGRRAPHRRRRPFPNDVRARCRMAASPASQWNHDCRALPNPSAARGRHAPHRRRRPFPNDVRARRRMAASPARSLRHDCRRRPEPSAARENPAPQHPRRPSPNDVRAAGRRPDANRRGPYRPALRSAARRRPVIRARVSIHRDRSPEQAVWSRPCLAADGRPVVHSSVVTLASSAPRITTGSSSGFGRSSSDRNPKCSRNRRVVP